MQVPAASRVTVMPVIEQTSGVIEANSMLNPLVEVSVDGSENATSPKDFVLGATKVIV